MAAAEPGAGVEVAPVGPPLRQVDGLLLAAGLRSALSWLQANQEAVNDLNVFPVPDGDTGSNMYLTLRSAVEDVQRLPDPTSAAAVAQAAAHGSLMGARGNSGVILSQVLRGFAQGIGARDRIDAATFAAALEEAANVAYRAVIKPTEGTVLTVVRESAAAARHAAESSDDVRTVLQAAVHQAHAAVERTPQQLAVLREAGVVDAGGFGFAVLFEGFARALADPTATSGAAPAPAPASSLVGEPPVRAPGEPLGPVRRGAAAVAEREQGWGYCTEFLINGPGLDVETLRRELSALGESSLVVGDADVIRVHIHTHDPATLIAAAARRGRLSRLKVEDMTAQHHQVLARAEAAETGTAAGSSAALAAGRKPFGIVTVAPGEGFRRILRGLGADEVVLGGQTMNPSIEDLLTAVRAIAADAVVILPNNGNVILTAQQVDALAGNVRVRVIPTRNLPQGISALLAADPSADLEANCARMAAAMESVTAVEVTRAVRDSSANGKDIRSGDVIAVVDGAIAAVGLSAIEVVEAVLSERERAVELMTVYRGAGVDDRELEEFVAALRRSHPDMEIEVHEGGQEHYPFILSLE